MNVASEIDIPLSGMSFIQANGLRICYRIDGPTDAPVVVLSNSLGTTMEMWAPQINVLSQRFRVLRYDTRGHGKSDVPTRPYRLEQLGADVLALLDNLDIERAHFCGISLGGMTGLWLGIYAGDRFDRMVVSNTAARIGTEESWRERSRHVREEGMSGVVASASARWFTSTFAQDAPQQIGPPLAALRDASREGYASCCDALAQADLRMLVGAIEVPMLVMAGKHDPITTVADAIFIAERLARARVVTLDAGHLSNIEAADAFNENVMRFLSV